MDLPQRGSTPAWPSRPSARTVQPAVHTHMVHADARPPCPPCLHHTHTFTRPSNVSSAPRQQVSPSFPHISWGLAAPRHPGPSIYKHVMNPIATHGLINPKFKTKSHAALQGLLCNISNVFLGDFFASVITKYLITTTQT